MVDYKIIGERLRQKRHSSGLTQEYVAEKADITAVYLSKIENGHVRPTLDRLSELCEALNLDMSELLHNVVPAAPNYQNERVIQYFNACSPSVKPIALDLLKELSKVK